MLYPPESISWLSTALSRLARGVVAGGETEGYKQPPEATGVPGDVLCHGRPGEVLCASRLGGVW